MKTISNQTIVTELLPHITNGIFVNNYVECPSTITLECNDTLLSFILTDVVNRLPNNQHRREQFYYDKKIPQFKAAVDNFIKLVEMNGGNYYSEDGFNYIIIQYHEVFCVFHMELTDLAELRKAQVEKANMVVGMWPGTKDEVDGPDYSRWMAPEDVTVKNAVQIEAERGARPYGKQFLTKDD